MKKKDIDKYMYLDYSRGYNKALDEVEKMIDKHLKGYGRNDCDCDYCIGMRNLKQNIKELKEK